MDYYKKVDKSVFRYGITIPKKYQKTFLHDEKIKPGSYRKIYLRWENKRKKYDARLWNIRRKNAQSVYQLRWDTNYDLLLTLRREFIQSYLAIESKSYEAKSTGKYYVTDLLGGNQEVLIFRPLKKNEIELETFIRISTPYDNIFKRLVEKNVFGWLFRDIRDYLITKSTRWYDIKELKSHEDAENVIYYLIDEKKREIYIGSAKVLGNRVKLGRQEIPGWNKFKYDIVHPDYHHLLRRIEHHTIRSFASFFKNTGNVQFVKISSYKLVNRNWPKRK